MKAKILTAEQKRQVMSVLKDPKDLDVNAIVALFARSKKRGVAYIPEDIMYIDPADSPYVKLNSKTTIGIYVVNKYVFEDLKIFGYINKTIDGKVASKINGHLADALMAGDITRDQYGEYIDRTQWLFGGPLALIINTSLSETILSLPPAAKAVREKLLKEHNDELKMNDPQVSVHIEKEVVDVALAEMRKKNDPAMALFDADAGIDPYNQYKTIFVMKGAIQDNTGESPTGYKIITSNYDTGITKEDMPKIADTVVTSAFSSGVATQDSGTNGKKYNALFQRVRLRDRNSDCKSVDTIDTEITPENADDYVYRYIREGSKIVMLSPDNIKSYYNKTVKMRTGIHCKAPDPLYCSRCIGDRPYRIGIRNIGFTYLTISGSTLNGSLKKKHDVSIKMYNITIDDVMKYVTT